MTGWEGKVQASNLSPSKLEFTHLCASGHQCQSEWPLRGLHLQVTLPPCLLLLSSALQEGRTGEEHWAGSPTLHAVQPLKCRGFIQIHWTFSSAHCHSLIQIFRHISTSIYRWEVGVSKHNFWLFSLEKHMYVCGKVDIIFSI